MEANADIEHDIAIIQRNYSSLRKISKKWMNPDINSNQESIPIEYIEYRSSLKRNSNLFKEFMVLWEEINPLNLRGISQALYTSVNTFLYADIDENEDQRSEFVKQDLKADFQGYSSLTFCETYDSFFELVDNTTKSKLVCEYIKTLRGFIDKIKSEEYLKFFNFWSKKHLEEENRICYQRWMLRHFKNMKGLKSPSPKAMDTLEKKFNPPTFLERPQKNLYTKGDVTLKRIKKMICFSQRTIKTHQSPRPIHVPRLKKKPDRGKLKVQVKRRSFNRMNFKLEEIIKNRKMIQENQLEDN